MKPGFGIGDLGFEKRVRLGASVIRARGFSNPESPIPNPGRSKGAGP